MKIKTKAPKHRVLNTILATALSASMVLGAAAVTDSLFPSNKETAKAEETTSNILGTTGQGKYNWQTEKTYTFSGLKAKNGKDMQALCVRKNSDGTYMFVSTGLTSGCWPGTKNGAASSSSNYTSDNTGTTSDNALNINNYDSYTQALVSYLGDALSGTLYLPTGTSNDNVEGDNTVLSLYKNIAPNHSSFGADSDSVWLGSPSVANYACCVDSGGVNSNGRDFSYCVAPAFNLKQSSGSEKLTNISGQTAITAKSKQSVNSWETTPITSIVESSGVKTSTGATTRYTVTSKNGFISGSNYTPGVSSRDIADALIVKSVDHPDYTPVTLTLTVKGIPDSANTVTGEPIKSGQTYNLSDIAKSSIDGMKITDSLGYIKDGKYVVPGTARDLVDKITFSVGTYSATKEVNIAANTDIKQDSEGYYVVNDDNGIEWHFLYNDSGQIGYLYASSANIGKLVTNDSSKTLNVPSTINGITVAGIGTNSSAHNFLNDTDGATGSTVWKNVYIPASVKTIRGYAFAGNTASAKVEIPSTVQNIEEHAFDGSSITEVKFDDASKLTIGESAFANIPTLTTVTLRGNGAKIGTKAFYNDGIQKLNIPAGTTMESGGNSFSKNESLTELKIDATTVPDNSFVDTPKLAKVVFGENVKQVNALWTGKQSEATGEVVNRTTYALGKDTIFNCKQDGSVYYSPFGISGTLNVWGLQSDQVFNNGAGPVYAFNNGANNAYAKGEASSETTHISMNGTAGMDGLGDGDVYDQTGIEGSYSGTLLGGANATKDASTLNKNNMTVRKLFGTDAKGTYKTSDFYVMRSQVYDDQVKGKSFSNYTTEGNINTIKDEETQKMLDFYDSMDNVEVNDTDVSNGAITVTAVVLQTITADVDGSSKTFYLAKQNQDGSASMLTWTCEVTIPVKQYSEFNLFNDVYGGDFSKITQAITDAQAKNDKLQADLTAKQVEVEKTQAQLDAINKKLADAGITAKTDESGNVDVSGAVETLESQKADLEKQIKDLKAQIGVSDDTDVAALKAQITTLKKQSDDYASLLSQYQSVIEKLQAGKGSVASDVKSDTIKTGDVTVTNDVPAGTYVYGDDGKWHEGSKDGKVVDGITTGDKTPNSGDTITVKVNDKPALTEDELKTLDGSNVIDTLEAQLAEQKQKTAAAEANYKALKDQTDKSAAEAQKNLEEAQKQQAEIQSQLDAAKKAKEEADKTLNDANATAEEKQAALQKQVDTLNTQVESLTKTNKEQGDKLTELQGNVASLGAQVSQYKDISDTVAQVAGIDVKGKSAAEVKEALSNMANEYVADKKAISTIAEATGQDPAKVASDPDAFAKTVTDKVNNGGGSLTDSERKSLNDRITELTNENSTLKTQNQTLQDKLNGSGSGKTDDKGSSSTTDSTDVTTLKAQLASSQAEAASYKTQADTYKGLYETASKNSGTDSDSAAKIASLTTENASLTAENKSLSDDNNELTEKNKKLSSENDDLSSENDDLTSRNKSLSKKAAAKQKTRTVTKTKTVKVPVTKTKTVTRTVKVPVTKTRTVQVPVTKTVTVPGATKTKTITKTVKKYVNADGTITDKPKDTDKTKDDNSKGSVTVTPSDSGNNSSTPSTTEEQSASEKLREQSQNGNSDGTTTTDQTQATDPSSTEGNVVTPEDGNNNESNLPTDTQNKKKTSGKVSDTKQHKSNPFVPIVAVGGIVAVAAGVFFSMKKKGGGFRPSGSSSADDIDDDDISDDEMMDDDFTVDDDNIADDSDELAD